MIQTAIYVFLLIVAVIAVPLWAQLVIFAVTMLFIPERIALLIPAVFADVLYSPTRTLSPENLKMTIFTIIILIAYWLVITQTRVSHVYGLETK